MVKYLSTVSHCGLQNKIAAMLITDLAIWSKDLFQMGRFRIKGTGYIEYILTAGCIWRTSVSVSVSVGQDQKEKIIFTSRPENRSWCAIILIKIHI